MIVKAKAIFLDRDGTINIEKNYIHKIEDFEFAPGAIEGLRAFQEAGFLLIIITNQSGIARGYYTEKDFQNLNEWMLEELKRNGISIENVYYCPHLPDAYLKKYRKECNCRKPLIGLFEQAILDYNIDLSQSYAIGDKIRDCAICKTTECKGFLIGNNEQDNVIEQVQNGNIPNVRYAINITEAVSVIIGEKS